MNNQKKSWLSQTIVGFGLTSLFNDFSHEMTNAILPAFIAQLVGAPYAALAVGIITGISDAASSITKVASGIITDRIKKYKPFLVFGYALTPIFVALIGTAHSIWTVLIFKIIAWTGKGIREPMRDTWISQIITPAHYGRAFGFVRALDTIGAILGPLVAFFALPYYDLRTIFFISFIPGIISVLALIFLTKQEEFPRFENPYKNWREQFAHLPARFNYFVLAMFIFGIGNFNKLLIIYRAQELLLGETHSFIVATGWAILLYTLFNCVRALSEFGFGTLSDYYHRPAILGFFGFGLFGLVNILLMISSDNIFVWALIFISAGMSTGAVTAVEKAYAAQLLPEAVRGTGFGFLQMIDGVGDLVSSVLVGILWTYISPNSSFLYALIMSIIALMVLAMHSFGKKS